MKKIYTIFRIISVITLMACIWILISSCIGVLLEYNFGYTGDVIGRSVSSLLLFGIWDVGECVIIHILEGDKK